MLPRLLCLQTQTSLRFLRSCEAYTIYMVGRNIDLVFDIVEIVLIVDLRQSFSPKTNDYLLISIKQTFY